MSSSMSSSFAVLEENYFALLSRIFSFLSLSEFKSVSRVCKKWRLLSSNHITSLSLQKSRGQPWRKADVDKFLVRFCHVSTIKISGVPTGMRASATSAILEATALNLERLEIDDVEGDWKLPESESSFEKLKYFSFEFGQNNKYVSQILTRSPHIQHLKIFNKGLRGFPLEKLFEFSFFRGLKSLVFSNPSIPMVKKDFFDIVTECPFLENLVVSLTILQFNIPTPEEERDSEAKKYISKTEKKRMSADWKRKMDELRCIEERSRIGSSDFSIFEKEKGENEEEKEKEKEKEEKGEEEKRRGKEKVEEENQVVEPREIMLQNLRIAELRELSELRELKKKEEEKRNKTENREEEGGEDVGEEEGEGDEENSYREHIDPRYCEPLELLGDPIVLEKLQILEIHFPTYTRFSNRALNYISSISPNLRKYSVHCREKVTCTITDTGIRNLSANSPLIEEMELDFPIFSQYGGGFMAGFPHLRKLKIRHLLGFTVDKKTFLANMKFGCPKLTFLRHGDDDTIFA